MRTQTLKVPGATLYYETRGSGSVLLMIMGGFGDAGGFEEAASYLAKDYTVVTYDPRGNSRSPLDGPPEDQQIAVHSEDARRLLETVSSEPAAVFGTSSGAIVGLDLIARHPTLVSRLVVHEPPLLELLPDVAKWHAFHDDLYETYQREGAFVAGQKWTAGVGLENLVPPVLATWDIRSEKGTLRGIYWSHSACGREAEKVESESIHVFQTLTPFILFAKEKPVFPVLIPIRQRIALCFHALYGGIVRWMEPRSTSLLFGTIADLAKGKSELLVENALLRQQLIILHRQVKRPACKKTDKFLLLRATRG